MMWRKTSNNYQKWDYFTDSSEEEKESDPIVPKNDPNFMALEKDMEDRKKKTGIDKKKADLLKEEVFLFISSFINISQNILIFTFYISK